jgi:hypothetical protein
MVATVDISKLPFLRLETLPHACIIKAIYNEFI